MSRRVRPLWPVLLCIPVFAGQAAPPPASSASVRIEGGRLKDAAPPSPEEPDAEEAELASELAAGLVQNACLEVANGPHGAPLLRARTNVAYGPHPLQQLDLYAPSTGGPFPVMVFIHGGGFSLGDKGPHARKARSFVEAGYVFVSVNYRLAPAAKHPLPTEDVALALGWLKDHVPEYGGDPRLMFVSGHSAGAHLAALVATDARYLNAQKMRPQELAGIILLDGAGYDISARLKRGNKKTWKMYTDAFGTEPAGWRDASPPLQVEADEALPPFLIFYAGNRPGPKAQALTLSGALQASGAQVETLHAADRNHETIHKYLGTAGDSVTLRIFSFVEQARLQHGRVAAEAQTP